MIGGIDVRAVWANSSRTYPFGKVKQDAREEGRLNEAKDEPGGNDLPGGLDLTGQERHQAPDADLHNTTRLA